MTDETEPMTFPYALSKRPWIPVALCILMGISISIIAYLTTGPASGGAVAVVLLILAPLYLVHELILTPYEVVVQDDGMTCRYHLLWKRFYTWDKVIWLQFVPPVRKNREPETYMDFKRELYSPMHVSYSAGLAISEAYSKKMGKRPMDEREYMDLKRKRSRRGGRKNV